MESVSGHRIFCPVAGYGWWCISHNNLRQAFLAICLTVAGLCVHSAADEERGPSLNISFSGDALELSPTVFEHLEIRWTRADFLLSHLAVRDSSGEWLSLPGWYGFISAGEQRREVSISSLPEGEFDRIRFAIGVDPATNKLDPATIPADHPLNPSVNNLHWGWMGGFIFAALEGHVLHKKSGHELGFSYHLANDGNELWIETEIPEQLRNLRSIDGTLNIEVTLQLEELFLGSGSLDPFAGQSSTHSRAGDPVTGILKSRIKRAVRTEAALLNPGAGSPAAVVRKSRAPEGHTRYFVDLPDHFPRINFPADNPLTTAGVELGRQLFHDPVLSKGAVQSCAGCHDVRAAFSDPGRAFSIGVDGLPGLRNAMPLFNLAWSDSFFWDGRAGSLREQSLMPIQDPLEMHSNLADVVERLEGIPSYKRLFRDAFMDGAVSSENIGLALEQFMLTLISADSRFDRAIAGRGQLTPAEQRGLELFVTEFDPSRGLFGADCFHCHGGPLFTSNKFANNGLPPMGRADAGLGGVTGREADMGLFRIPSLRNIAVTGPYMHDGRFNTLEEVIDHYNGGVHRTSTLDPNLAKHPETGLQLSGDDRKALVAFLKTLTDESFINAGQIRPGAVTDDQSLTSAGR